jgi:N-acyl-L-homoserine lactone synthetase
LLVSSNVIPGEKPKMSDFFTRAREAGFRKLGWIATRAATATTIKPAMTIATFMSTPRETLKALIATGAICHAPQSENPAWGKRGSLVG